MEKEFFTVQDVAERFDAHVKTVMSWVKEGELKGFKAGRTWYFRKSDIDAYIESGYTRAEQELAEQRKQAEAEAVCL